VMTAAIVSLLCLFQDGRYWPLHSPSVQTRRAGLSERQFKDQRLKMVEQQLQGGGVTDRRVLKAMQKVPRHRFVPASELDLAYAPRALPIGYGQTISQPYIVAYMTEAAALSGSERVLEIGTGSGYQAAILAELAKEVYTIEIIPELAERARETLNELGYHNIHVKIGNGYAGWTEHAPYDAIIVTAAPEEVPTALVEQLALGGRMVIPVGATYRQALKVITKTRDGLSERELLPVRFVPMTGKQPKQ
jgi:protein-L-isoaspartate(D-aspartate) O-methyltransferase